MEIIILLIIIFSYFAVPIFAKKIGKNPILYFALSLLIGPLAFIPLVLKGHKTPTPEFKVTGPFIENVKPGLDSAASPVIDARVAACPSCGAVLKKIPGSKTKCPHCNKFLFIRTDSKSNSRIVVNAEQAETIDEEWAKINGSWEELQIQKNRFAQSKSDLTAKFGTAASDGDVNWRLLNEDLIQHSSMQNWGHYRNTVFQMGEQLRKEGKFAASLEKFLLVCYIDICGPNNIYTPLGKKHEYGQEPFSKRSSFLAPGVTKRIEKSAIKAKFDIKKLREMFYKLEEEYKQAIPFTQSAEKSWGKLKSEIYLS
jgi:predicted RNA-binding Zn-ribbon protein involved in translation (DUF1610 family)